MKTRIYKSNSCGEFFLTGESKKEHNCIKHKIQFIKTGYSTWARIHDINFGTVNDELYPVHQYFGKKLESNNYGPFIVLPLIYFNLHKNRNEYMVYFLETGYSTNVCKKEIDERKIKDPLAKKIFDIACLGNAKKQDNPQLYAIWFAMLNRCYNKTNKQYKWYGEKGTTVDEEWHVFENFLNDVVTLEGYDKNKLNRKELNLDKDKKQPNVTKKIYSKNFCCWITPKENQNCRSNNKSIK